MLAFITKMLVLVLIYSYNIIFIPNIFSRIETCDIHCNYLIIYGSTWII